MTSFDSMTLKQALDWIAEIFEESPGSLAPSSRREDIHAWDSMGVLALMAGMDEKFGIVLGSADLEAMKSVDDILEVLRKFGKLA